MPTYTVKKGDSWARIAGRVYGNQRMLGMLQEANAGIGGLRPGMVINLPGPEENPFVSEAHMAGFTQARWDRMSPEEKAAASASGGAPAAPPATAPPRPRGPQATKPQPLVGQNVPEGLGLPIKPTTPLATAAVAAGALPRMRVPSVRTAERKAEEMGAAGTTAPTTPAATTKVVQTSQGALTAADVEALRAAGYAGTLGATKTPAPYPTTGNLGLPAAPSPTAPLQATPPLIRAGAPSLPWEKIVSVLRAWDRAISNVVTPPANRSGLGITPEEYAAAQAPVPSMPWLGTPGPLTMEPKGQWTTPILAQPQVAGVMPSVTGGEYPNELGITPQDIYAAEWAAQNPPEWTELIGSPGVTGPLAGEEPPPAPGELTPEQIAASQEAEARDLARRAYGRMLAQQMLQNYLTSQIRALPAAAAWAPKTGGWYGSTRPWSSWGGGGGGGGEYTPTTPPWWLNMVNWNIR